MRPLTIERAREIAARVWCDPEFSHVEMHVNAAEQIAEILVQVSLGNARGRGYTMKLGIARKWKWLALDELPTSQEWHFFTHKPRLLNGLWEWDNDTGEVEWVDTDIIPIAPAAKCKAPRRSLHRRSKTNPDQWDPVN